MNIHLRDFEGDAMDLVPKMIRDNLNIIEVPESEGIVVVRASVLETTTEEFNDRTGEPDITKFLLNTGTVDKFYIFSR